jgi:PAS domain S-box-containing protein
MGAGLSGLNLRSGEVDGLTLFEYFKTDDSDFPPIAAIRRALTGQSVNFEQEWGGNFYQVYVEPLRRKDTIVGTLGVALDVTPQKLAEQELRDARDVLEQKMEQRTRELRTANRILREDVTQHEQMEKSLRESEQRFRIIAETIPVPIVITRIADGQIVYANRRAGEALNVPHDTLIGQPSTHFYKDPDVREQILQLIDGEGHVTDFEVQAKRPDGLLRWVSVSLQPLSFQEQPCLLAAIVDVTERKAAAQSLKNEQELLKRLLDLHDRDRQLIAYEIHDGVVQQMTAALMFLEAYGADFPEQNIEAAQTLASATKLLRAGIDEARRLINGLRPEVLEQLGIVAAIQVLVEEIQATSNLQIQFVHDVQFGRLAPALEMALYRIVQESLNNVRQHSGSPTARVELIQRKDHVAIVIEDWGKGFDPANVRPKRYGLTGVRERARLLGGRAKIKSVAGQGTCIEVELPLTDVLSDSTST